MTSVVVLIHSLLIYKPNKIKKKLKFLWSHSRLATRASSRANWDEVRA